MFDLSTDFQFNSNTYVCYDPITLTLITVGATLAGAAVSAAGTIASGNAQAEQLQTQGVVAKQSADFRAAQLENKAQEERAAGQIEAAQFRDRKERALSTLQARSAASGFSATDPTSIALADEITRFGTLQEQLAMFGGESRAKGLNLSAAGERFSGDSEKIAGFKSADAAIKGSRFSAAGTILGGIGSSAGTFANFSKPAPRPPRQFRYG